MILTVLLSVTLLLVPVSCLQDNMYTINHRTLLSSVSVLSKGVFGKLVETLWYQLSSSNQDVALNAGIALC